ncbi:glycoside hydrolase family 16 protein [Pseudonocardia endophytica]|uniref:Glycosyl hydrolase family 16 n=1 Tax=Pseudonocardia endophytica TaxID=401976 RepID=A0A4R1I2Z2_PSEEN|nr:glycoside hydrolase family 16 protein [Pseudonocardia endophytica]TCK24322.1 glycosyl hydrolase family 16 [Pseudonocardia endophytica]
MRRATLVLIAAVLVLTGCATSTPVPPPGPPDLTQAAVRNNWGTPDPVDTDEFDGDTVDLGKWQKFGTQPGLPDGCSSGYSGHGQRCGSQTTEGDGHLTVTGTADGVTGGLSSAHGGFRYGRVEVRERAFPTQAGGGKDYHAVPLLFPVSADYTRSEIDYAERDVGAKVVEINAHHDGTQTGCQFPVDTTAWHNYAVDWEPDSVTWFVDGIQRCRLNVVISDEDSSNGGAQLDMFPPTGTPMRPAEEQVDWIRMYPVPATRRP